MTLYSIAQRFRVDNPDKFRLSDCDSAECSGLTVDKAEANQMLKQGIELLSDLQERLYASDRWSVLIVLQAMDAAGKDSAIKHVMSGLNPQGVEVHSFKEPSAEELALLEPFRGQVPDEVFGEPYVPPVTDGTGQDRRWLHRAAQLLNGAGYAIDNRKRVLPSGERITIEFLIDEPTFQPHHMPFIKNLGTLGIDASLRIVDPVQYRKRVDDFDFDITVERMSFSSTPGDSLRNYFSSQAAAIKGSQNLAGIADPAVDALVDHIIAAKTRSELTAGCRALDRVIRAGHYWIPHWYKASHWIAYWDVFGRPAVQPPYFRGIPDTWWYDRDRAAKLEQKG